MRSGGFSSRLNIMSRRAAACLGIDSSELLSTLGRDGNALHFPRCHLAPISSSANLPTFSVSLLIEIRPAVITHLDASQLPFQDPIIDKHSILPSTRRHHAQAPLSDRSHYHQTNISLCQALPTTKLQLSVRPHHVR